MAGGVGHGRLAGLAGGGRLCQRLFRRHRGTDASRVGPFRFGRVGCCRPPGAVGTGVHRVRGGRAGRARPRRRHPHGGCCSSAPRVCSPPGSTRVVPGRTAMPASERSSSRVLRAGRGRRHHVVQAGRVTWEVSVAAVGVGILACALLVANNLRDMHTEPAAGKRTLAVVFGQAAPASPTSPCSSAFHRHSSRRDRRALVPPPLAAVPLAVAPIRTVVSGAQGREMIPVFGGTGRLDRLCGGVDARVRPRRLRRIGLPTAARTWHDGVMYVQAASGGESPSTNPCRCGSPCTCATSTASIRSPDPAIPVLDPPATAWPAWVRRPEQVGPDPYLRGPAAGGGGAVGALVAPIVARRSRRRRTRPRPSIPGIRPCPRVEGVAAQDITRPCAGRKHSPTTRG